MKQFTLFILLGLSSISFSGAGLGQIEPYTIVSDSMASAVPVGFCLVKGFAYNYGVGVPNGKVSTLNGDHKTLTDSSGAYKLLIPSIDTALFFFKTQYNEVVVWNYNFKSQHVVTLNFNSDANNQMIISAKPVIYLYSEKELTATLDLDYRGELTFTYPQLKEEWTVSINKSGIVCEGKKYPYLFWEGESEALSFNFEEDKSINGELVPKENVVAFLEEKLAEMGFNQTEKTDFITFWGPRMIKSNYVLVQFIVDQEYESQIAALNVEPKPDASKRVYMFFAPSEKVPPIKCNPQSFESFQREGFTLLEWGGSEFQLEQINL